LRNLPLFIYFGKLEVLKPTKKKIKNVRNVF